MYSYLIRKDVGEHGTSLAQVGTIGSNRGRHGVVAADTNAEDDTEDSEPNE